MTDYLGNIALASTGTYQLASWSLSASGKSFDSVMPMAGDHVATTAPNFAGEATISVEVMVIGSSVATLTAAVRALRAEANVPRNTYVHAPGSSGDAVAFTVLECVRQDVVEDGAYGLAYHQLQALTLRVAPFAAGALQTLHNAVTVATPDSLSLAALLGDLPVPLRTYCDDASGVDIHSLYLALAPRALTDTMWILDEPNARWTWSGGSAASIGANEYGGEVRRNNSTTAMTGTVDTSGYPAGFYKLVARASVAAGYGYLRTNLHGANDDVTITNTTLAYVELGSVWLPPSATKSGTASNLVLYVTGDGTNYTYVDYLLLLPQDSKLGLVSYHPKTSTQEIDEFDIGPAGLFLDGATDWTDVKGDPLRPRTTVMHCPELITTHTPDGANWPTDWTRGETTDVTATGSLFQVVSDAAAVRYAYAGPFVVTPHEWYEITLSKQVTAWTSADADVYVRWYDVAANLLSAVDLANYAATDVAPVAVSLYAQAPTDAAYGRVYVETEAGADTTIQFSAVYFHRCPLNLLIASEDAAGTGATQDVAVTVQAVPRYEGAR